MKKQIWIRWLWLLVFIINACTSGSQAASPAPTTEPLAVEDKASLIAALEAAGTTVETGEPISQDFFTPEASILKINDADVQVFEYGSAEEMEKEALEVSPDGGSIGTSMLMWVDVPHFYKSGRIIVLYVGSDATVLNLLEATMGQQFAGR